MNFPSELKYTKDHEWIRIEGNTGVIGITEYAQGELGDVVFVDINPSLTELKSGEIFGSIEAVKTVSDLYAPCSGKVLEINQNLNNNPDKVNSDPYGEGWMIKIEITNTSELGELLDSSTYAALTGN
ncbi:MAG: glycine cleavage system protein GcvH [Ignavibacteriales bacterium]|nr:Glycine cleavage system H protein [Ignavibacteriaceae bacterium]MCK6614514.1 glycine cleavage system protein GcvH [Ignavibacteriaceae bacterium]QOJ29753.1 MAG: glycine cleavage system protein GcvH [Ignavibacteriales bacterium]